MDGTLYVSTFNKADWKGTVPCKVFRRYSVAGDSIIRGVFSYFFLFENTVLLNEGCHLENNFTPGLIDCAAS